MAAPLNVLLVVVDSLRQKSVARLAASPNATASFFAQLGAETACFSRAYAAECWTLPSHVSMFTGLLPSEHGAHFQSMGYAGHAPTIAELLAGAGFHTEIVTRNHIFDGTIPGVTRGFTHQHWPLARFAPGDLLGWYLALTKPRSRRLLRDTGFFHPRHRASRDFLVGYSRALLPADDLALAYTLSRLSELRNARQPHFLFLNLYDVHWPYPADVSSVLAPWSSLANVRDNLAVPWVLPKIGSHAYLRDGFHMPRWAREMLERRYHRSIELAAERLARFWASLRALGVLNDTLVILTSDHGEAFGEHGLYMHDASAYQVHLHVPLWIHHPESAPAHVDDVVTTRDLFGLMKAAAAGAGAPGTILNSEYRHTHPLAAAEHFYYPRAPHAAARFRRNLATLIGPDGQFVLDRGGQRFYPLGSESGEPSDFASFAGVCVRRGTSPDALALGHKQVCQWLDTLN